KLLTGVQTCALPIYLHAARGLALEERGDRHAERRRDAAERVQRGRQPSRFDLRHHAGRELGLLGQLSLLQVALEPQRLDSHPERRHVTISSRYGSTSTMTSRPWTATATWIEPLDSGASRTTPTKFTKGPSRI